MSEWQTVTIDEICKLVTSGGTPLTSKKEYYHNGNISWVKTKEVNQCRIYGTENHITQLGLDSSSAKLIPENSIIIAMYGDGKTAGRVALNKVPVTTNQACCNLVLDPQYANYDFVFYNLMGRYDELVSKKTGSGQQNLNGKIIKEIEIDLPPLPEQKAIASVLSSLDEKIDLLHRQNKTLEAMAETLFRQWFIEEAKEDWEKESLGDVVKIAYGKNLPTSKLQNSGYPVFGGNGQIGFYDRYLYEKKQVLVSCRGEASGKVNISYPYSFVTNNSLVLELKQNGITFEYLKFYALSYDFGLHVSGSAQPQITIDGLFNAEFKWPPITKIEQFTNIVGPMEDKRLSNTNQIQTLKNLRDSLLPKFMNGEVRVQYQTDQIA